MALQTLMGMRALPCVAAALLLSLAGAASADDPSPAMTGVARPSVEELAIPVERPKETQLATDTQTLESICLMVEAAARANDLPLEFFARVIWQESRFQVDIVGPVTRNGQRAQGIAQFMPGTASERRLLDPFDPVQALPKSAEFLAELRAPNPFVTELEQRIQLSAAKLWGVQLAAGFDRNRAMASYARAMRRLRPVIGDQDPSLLATVFRSRGTRTFYQVRIGADTRPAADTLCSRIRLAGEACFVLRNRGVRG